MNIKKKIVSLGMALLVLCGTLTSTYAYVFTEGTKYQAVSFTDIPGGGHAKYDTYYGSKKATTGYFATFKKTYGEAALGNFAGLINSSKTFVSGVVGIPLNTPNLATEKGCGKGTIYFSSVSSSGVEPSNSCDVRMGFSADNLKPLP